MGIYLTVVVLVGIYSTYSFISWHLFIGLYHGICDTIPRVTHNTFILCCCYSKTHGDAGNVPK